MKLNLLFLLIGLALTIISKVLQIGYKSRIGDLVVIPAAVFFVLAVLFSIRKFTDLPGRENGVWEAAQIGFWACLAVVSFQVMMILVAGQGKPYGLLLLIPFVISTAAFIYGSQRSKRSCPFGFAYLVIRPAAPQVTASIRDREKASGRHKAVRLPAVVRTQLLAGSQVIEEIRYEQADVRDIGDQELNHEQHDKLRPYEGQHVRHLHLGNG